MPSHSNELGTLGEPAIQDYLQVIRRELPDALGHELHSTRAKGTLEMILALLDHLISRNELKTFHQGERQAHNEQVLETLKTLGVSTGSENPLSSGLTHDLDSLIENTVLQIDTLSGSRRINALNALSSLVLSENTFLRKIDDCEKSIADTCGKLQESITNSPERINTYLQRHSLNGLPQSVKEVGSPLGGYSKEVFVVSLEGPGKIADKVVVRRDLTGGPLESSVADEFELLKIMHAENVPVAEPLWLELDESHLGGKLMVLSFAEGTPLTDFRANIQGENATQQIREFARILAKVHTVPVGLISAQTMNESSKTNDRIRTLISTFRDQWLRRRETSNPVIAAGLAWMSVNIPDGEITPVIVHGDYSLRNMLFNNGRATALLDWETWHIGDPAEDLAYCREEVEAVMNWQEFVAEYQKAGGPSVREERVRYWQFWKYLRGAITSVSMMNAVADKRNRADIRTAFGGVFFTRFCLERTSALLEKAIAEEIVSTT